MGTCLVGWAHSRFGRRGGLDLEALIGGVTGEAIARAGIAAGEMQVPGAELAGVFNLGGSAVASCVSILERTR